MIVGSCLSACGATDRIGQMAADPAVGVDAASTDWVQPTAPRAADPKRTKETVARYQAGQPLLPPVPQETSALAPVVTGSL